MTDSVQTGLVGYFDILGYANLLEKNEPETIAEEVLPVLTDLGTLVKEKVQKTFLHDIPMKAEREQAIEDIDWLVYSDTVLLTMPLQESDEVTELTRWGQFVLACGLVLIELFDAGLPSRGAIDHGRFFVKDTCFAGRTIVDAYHLAESLDLSACALTQKAARELQRFHTNPNLPRLEDHFLLKYCVPLKNGEEHLWLLASQQANSQTHGLNIREIVLDAFWSHNRDLPLAAQSKVANTIQWLEFQHRQKRLEAKATENETVETPDSPPKDESTPTP